MSPTPPGPLARSNYLSWPPGPYQADADPDSTAFDPAAVLPATGIVTYGDAALDAEQYQRPLERLHGMGLHAPGVAFGMQITCVVGGQQVTIGPGLALDPAGRHIYLAVGGSAEIGPSAGVPGTPPDLTPVSAAGAILPTTGLPAGTFYVVAQWRETWSADSYASDPNISQYNDTPWLQLVTAGDYLPDLQVILGDVVLDGASNVTSASYGDVGGLQRTSVGLPAQGVQLQRAVTTAAPGADTVPWGGVRAREAGGVEIAVANGSDQVVMLSDAGGVFDALAVIANQATVGYPGNPGINLDGAEATIKVGAPGNYGDVLVYDGNNDLAVSLVGDTAHVIVGGETLAGQVRMKNAQAQDSMSLDGDVGSATVQRVSAFANNLIDVDTTLLHVHGTDLALDGRSHNNNRALVDWGDQLVINYAGDYPNGVQINSGLQVDGVLTDGQDIPLMGNPARKAISATLLAESDLSGGAPSNNSQTLTIDFGNASQFTAFAFMNYVQNYVQYSYNAMAVAEVYQIDGTPTQVVGSGSDLGDIFTPVVTNQSGTTVGFRVRATDNSIEVQASIVVFYE